MGSDSLNLFNKAGAVREASEAKNREHGMKERDGVPACEPAILNKERYRPKWSANQYIHTNTSASFVRSSQKCTWEIVVVRGKKHMS